MEGCVTRETYECKVDIRVIGEGFLDAYQMLPAFCRHAKMNAYVEVRGLYTDSVL